MEELDHRSIANRLELFHQQDEGPGVVFWHPRGFALYRVIEDYIRRRMTAAGYREVRSPQLLARSLWEDSGHWQKFSDSMFAFEEGERCHALKPMSCPGHIQIFRHGTRSWRDLPLRYFELGLCHRKEPSGALQGLMRTRAFEQDDAHVFCREEQVAAEVARFCAMQKEIYADFGFPDVAIGFSTRPELRAGSEAQWDKAEALLEEAARSAGLDYQLLPGEGAFYGPKLEFALKDRAGRLWQCGTVQLDLVMPERLGAHYADERSEKAQAVLIHHAVLGSLERFIGILLEHYGGQLPLWLAPDQVVVASVTEAQADYAHKVAARLEEAGLRVLLDDGPNRLGRKIVAARELGVPLFLTVGEREAEHGAVSIRRGERPHAVLPLEAAAAEIAAEAAARPLIGRSAGV